MLQRIWISGSSGSGKTTLSITLSERLEIPRVELDGLFHGPGWTPADSETFRAAVRAEISERAWVVDGNYGSKLGGMVGQRAQLRIALDLPTWVVLARVIRRTLRRMLTQEELWNGNREPWSNLRSWDPGENIIRWTWVQRHAYRQAARDAENLCRAGGLPCVRLRSAGQVRRFVKYLTTRQV